MKKLFRRIAGDESGATAIEYGLIAAVLAIGIMAAVTLLGQDVAGIFNAVATKVTAAVVP